MSAVPGDLPGYLDSARDQLTAFAPAIAAVVLTFAVAWTLVRGEVRRRRHARQAAGANVIEIFPPPETDPASAIAFWTHLMGMLRPKWKRALRGQPHVAFEYVAGAGGVRIQLWVSGTVPPGFAEKVIRSAWPGTTVTSGADSPPLPPHATVTGGRLILARADHFPLTADHANDPLRALLEAMDGLGTGEHAVFQILARPVTGRRLAGAYNAAAALRGARPATLKARIFSVLSPGPPVAGERRDLARTHPERGAQVRAILSKADQARYETAIRYAAASTRSSETTEGWLRGTAHSLAAVAALYGSAHQHLRRRRLRNPARCLAARRLDRGYLLSVGELAALAHLPYDADAPGITRAGARTTGPPPAIPYGPLPGLRAPATSEPNGDEGRAEKQWPSEACTASFARDQAEADRVSSGGTSASGINGRPAEARVLGDADAGNRRPVALAVADARQHVHVLGETGSGKSTLLAQLVLADAASGRGALVIDPKGDLITDILSRLPEPAIGKTVVFDPADAVAPSVNVLAGTDPDFAADSIVSIFHRCFASSWGPRTDDLLRSALLTLTRVHGQRATLGQVPKLLTDSPYRARTVARLDDELLRGFWQAYDDLTPAGRSATIGPVMNKLRAFLLRPFIREALSQPTSTVNTGQLLNQGGLVLVRAPKGQLGDDGSRLFGSLLLAHAWHSVTRRTTTREQRRPDASIVVDECHNFLNLPGSVADMLAEARGYRLSLVLAHQHLAQLPRDLREALSADARNKVFFTTSPEDARDLRAHVGPVLTDHDLSHLGAYQAAARLIVRGAQTRAFTFRTRPLPAVIPGREAAVRAASRQLFTAWPAGRPSIAAKVPHGGDPRLRAQDPNDRSRVLEDPRADRRRP